MVGTILITGGAKRVGAQIIQHFNSCGWNVAFTYNSSENSARMLENTNVKAYKIDLTQVENIPQLIDNILNDFGEITLCINNASVFNKSKISDITPQILDENYKIHLYAPIFLLQMLHKNKQHTHTINIIDTNISRKTNTSFFAYLMSKKAMADFTILAASEFAPNMRINAILPGFIMKDKFMSSDADVAEAISKTPLKCIITIEDIIRVITFLHDSPTITGELIHLDAGKHLI